MLFKSRFLRGIGDGTVRVAYRRWKRPTVKAGGSLLTSVGQLAIDGVRAVTLDEIEDEDVRLAGFENREALLTELNRRTEGAVYRVDFHLAGPDPRIALRQQAELTPEEQADVLARLERLDGASRRGPWTRPVLEVIRDRPGVRAPDLAAGFGMDTQPFKRNVRKLKALGLTESLKVGYRLSPRGGAVLDVLVHEEPGAD